MDVTLYQEAKNSFFHLRILKELYGPLENLNSHESRDCWWNLGTNGLYWLGEQVQTLGWSQHLRCHFNVPQYCVPQVPCVESEHKYLVLKNYPLRLNHFCNTSWYVLKFQPQVLTMEAAKASGLENEQLWGRLTEGMTFISPSVAFRSRALNLLQLKTLLFGHFPLGHLSRG